MANIIVKQSQDVSPEYRKRFSKRVGGAPDDPYAFTAQILQLASPRVREAFSDLQREIHRQHERGVEEMMERIRGKRAGFRALPTLTLPRDPFRRLTPLERSMYGVPLGFTALVEHVVNQDRLQDAFIFADGDVIQVMTYGAQGGLEIPPGMARISTTCTLQLDGAQDAFHLFPPSIVKTT